MMDSEDNSFGELLELAQSGDETAIGKLLQNHRNYLLMIANKELDTGTSRMATTDSVE
jgi:hypothetical protein